MSDAVSPIPAGYPTVIPYMCIKGAGEALEFYAKAFNAVETVRMPGPGGMVMHAEMKIGESVIMLSEENCEQGQKSPVTLGGSATHVFLYVPDVDASFAQAIAAGATAIMPPMNMFWGDRFGKLKDPYGHEWSMATHVEDVTPEEMGKRMAEMFAGAPPA
ncbi:MAG: VOC family protein [Acidobacteria bacterium]|nr:VOC family protein [Acidobacteriota bacterium]